MPQEKDLQNEYEDIDLMDYVRVVIKRKCLVLATFLGIAIFAGTLSLLMPKVYKIDTILEVGEIEEKPIENLGELVGRIKSDIYGVEIRDKLEILEKDYPKIKVENPKNTNLIKIETDSSNTELAKNILTEINSLILKDSQEELEKKKGELENKIEKLKDKINSLEEKKQNIESEIEILEKIPLKDQTPASQFALFATKERLNAKEQEIENLDSQINSLEEILKNVQPTEIVKPPTVSTEPISPKPVLNTVIGATLGLFIGIFLAFGKEWWESNKENIDPVRNSPTQL